MHSKDKSYEAGNSPFVPFDGLSKALRWLHLPKAAARVLVHPSTKGGSKSWNATIFVQCFKCFIGKWDVDLCFD